MTLKSNLNKALNWCLDSIFPRSCLGCGKNDTYLCQNCYNTLPVANSVKCPLCGHRSPSRRVCQKCRLKRHFLLSGILVASDWDNLLLRQLIYKYKYHFIKELSEPLSDLLIEFLRLNKINQPTNQQTDKLILVPVPLHKKRLAWRGFNQSELLTRQIGKKLGLAVNSDILIRPRHTLLQKDISDEKDRIANIKNAFALSPKFNSANNNFLENKIVILIDDICTTGSTLQECARTLKLLKPKEIWGLVIARG